MFSLSRILLLQGPRMDRTEVSFDREPWCGTRWGRGRLGGGRHCRGQRQGHQLMQKLVSDLRSENPSFPTGNPDLG